MIENPFESGHVKNYLLFYASIVVIMVLFFIASTLFNDIETHEKKVFNTTPKEKKIDESSQKVEKEPKEKKFKLLDNPY